MIEEKINDIDVKNDIYDFKRLGCWFFWRPGIHLHACFATD